MAEIFKAAEILKIAVRIEEKGGII